MREEWHIVGMMVVLMLGVAVSLGLLGVLASLFH